MTLFHLGVWVCILCLAAALLGYRAGRRAGRREGWGKAAVMTPLILRRQAWRSGRCPVCGFAANLQPERLQAEGGRVPPLDPGGVLQYSEERGGQRPATETDEE